MPLACLCALGELLETVLGDKRALGLWAYPQLPRAGILSFTSGIDPCLLVFLPCAAWAPWLPSPSPADPLQFAAALGSWLSPRFWPCSFLPSWQLLNAFKEIANQKKAKYLTQVAPPCLHCLCLPTLEGWVWKTLPSLDVEVLLHLHVSYAPVKRFWSFWAPFSLIY